MFIMQNWWPLKISGPRRLPILPSAQTGPAHVKPVKQTGLVRCILWIEIFVFAAALESPPNCPNIDIHHSNDKNIVQPDCDGIGCCKTTLIHPAVLETCPILCRAITYLS